MKKSTFFTILVIGVFVVLMFGLPLIAIFGDEGTAELLPIMVPILMVIFVIGGFALSMIQGKEQRDNMAAAEAVRRQELKNINKEVICPHCGEFIGYGDRNYCPYCGKKIDDKFL